MFLNKNRKFRKDRLTGFSERLNVTKPSNIFGIRAMETGYLTSEQLEAARKSIQRLTKRYKKIDSVIVRVNPLISRSKKKKGLRMGASKGGFYRFVYRARPGMLLFELHHLFNYQILRRLKYILAKLPIQVNIIILRRWNVEVKS